jgi:dephospho-CoA kinase
MIVGLTGGIGSGKSTAAHLFAQRGIGVTDTDAIAHALTAPGQPALPIIADAFGAQYLAPDGTLDRAALRQLVFHDSAARTALENILHPRIRQAVTEALAEPSSSPYRIVVIPLLFETNGYISMLQRTLVIDCPEALQIQRTMLRSAMTESEVRAIMAVQISRGLRLSRADEVISNDSSVENLQSKVDEIHKKYLRLA